MLPCVLGSQQKFVTQLNLVTACAVQQYTHNLCIISCREGWRLEIWILNLSEPFVTPRTR